MMVKQKYVINAKESLEEKLDWLHTSKVSIKQTNKKYIFYITKINLKLFSVVHERRKDWKCENCSKEFSIRSNLMQHVKRMHGTGEKDHHCNTCGMTFFRGNDLNAHEKR